MDFDPDERREFLAADLVDVPVSSSFKEQLRRKLWKLVQRTYDFGTGGFGTGGHGTGHAGDDPS
jgi:hypothetical protein